MLELQSSQIKEISIDGLAYFDSICKANNLKYYLAFGSLLGAVRHRGFIPWDDDIDLLMPRSDYDRFIKLSSKIEAPEWEILSYVNNEGYQFIWTKLCNKRTELFPSRFSSGLTYGISLDIFPLDYIQSDNLEDAVSQKNQYRNRFKEIKRKNKPQNTLDQGLVSDIKRIYKKLNFEFKRVTGSYSLVADYMELEKEISKTKDGKFVAWMFDGVYDAPRTLWEKKYFWNSKKECNYLDFEGIKVPVPIGYHDVLTTTYGNYMVLPPKEKQVTHHTYKAYFK